MRRGTYSIVARDPQSGELGVAVQSHWFAVGPIVPWARAGVGAVATQAIAEPAYGPRLLDLLEAGHPAPDALARLLAEDDRVDHRQIAVVDARGRVGVHTGARCIAYAGDARGGQFSAQANMMGTPDVWPAMARAFRAAVGPLARRLAAALNAAEAHGGDVRGRQSAALLVVPAEGEAWRTRVDVRVDDDPEPLAVLDRLLDLADAYALAAEGDEFAGAGRHERAGERYAAASALAPGSEELRFWAALATAQAGDLPAAVEQVRELVAARPGWRELLDRLEPDIAPAAAVVRRALDER